MSPILAAFLRCALAPAAVTAVAVLAVGGLKDPLRARLQALFLALGFAAGNYLLQGRLAFPPTDAAEGLTFAALGCAFFVLLFPTPNQAPYLFQALMVALLGALVLWNLRAQLDTYVHKRNLAAFFCLGLGVWSIYERKIQSVNLLSLIGLPLISATALSFMLLFGASASFSQMVSILCALLGAMAAISLVLPGQLARAALVPFLSIFIILIMAAGHFYLDINPWKMVFLCVPFVFVWIRDWFPFVSKNPVVEFIFLAVMSLLPLGYLLYNSFVSAGPLY
jgi:hypothetical protein